MGPDELRINELWTNYQPMPEITWSAPITSIDAETGQITLDYTQSAQMFRLIKSGADWILGVCDESTTDELDDFDIPEGADTAILDCLGAV